MHIDQLRYFLYVSEAGSINAAAQKTFITQQAIHNSINKLEDELGTKLFTRSASGMTLTPQGRIFKAHAENILQEHTDMLLDLQRYESAEANLVGSLTIFVSSIFVDLFLPTIIQEFMVLHPKTSIKLIEVESENVLPYILHQQCDIALLSASELYIEKSLLQYAEQNPDFTPDSLQVIPLIQDEVVMCGRPDQPLMKYRILNNQILEDYSNQFPYRFSLYHILSYYLDEYAFTALSYTESISISGNAELHKQLMMGEGVFTFMPRLAYQLKFRKDGFDCRPMTASQDITHCMLVSNRPEVDNSNLRDFFSAYLQKRLLTKLEESGMLP